MIGLKTPVFVLAVVLVLALQAGAGTLSYTGIPARHSDTQSGISSDQKFTSAITAGNTMGNDLAVSGVKLVALSWPGNCVTANGITVDGSSGTLVSADNPANNVLADGNLRRVFSHLISATGAADGSREEIVVEPARLKTGNQYSLRVYIARSSDLDREVNLAFAGDGQPAVETGFFNEDDATTSPGKFANPKQAYSIDYKFTWDGKTCPGVIITQKSGAAPFCLYAVTNQEGNIIQKTEPETAEAPEKAPETRTHKSHHNASSGTSKSDLPAGPIEVSEEEDAHLKALKKNLDEGILPKEAYDQDRRATLQKAADRAAAQRATAPPSTSN